MCDPQNYCFDLDVLKRYVNTAHLDAIAITNHNRFDRDNYDAICAELDIPVFPGIEISVETIGKYGHVLLIAPSDYVDDFAADADTVASLLPDKESRVAWEKVCSAFSGISKYLVIPHYRKDKQLDPLTLEKIRKATGIDALEVSNAKKWLKEEGTTDEPLVMFSDCRPGLRMDNTDDGDSDPHRFAYGFTYVSCDEMSVPALKRAFAVDGNTAVFRDDDRFEVLPEALPVSTGLNVVLGSRTSGKTYTLNRIADAFDKSDISYIGQFEITKNAEEKCFNALVTAEDVKFEDGYLRPLQAGLNDYFDNDIEGARGKVRAYADAVISFANSPKDAASSTPIYRSQPYCFAKDDERAKNDVELRNAVRRLVSERLRVSVVAEHVDAAELLALDCAIREQMLEDVKTRLVKEKTNSIIAVAKNRLRELSVRKPLPDTAPLHDYFRFSFYEYTLAGILGKLLEPADLKSEEAGKFVKKRRCQPVSTATEARNILGGAIPTGTDLASLYKRSEPIDKLRLLRDYQDSLKAVSSKLLVQVKSVILDKSRGTLLSGGQRAEYVFIHKLEEARNKDIVLIDEPESSFDNVFLGSDISEALHQLADNATVFLVTHNNTLGVSINPDWIIYALYEDDEYKLFSGAMSSSELVSSTGEKVSRRDVLMSTMEAGWDAYEGRRLHYELAQDRR